MKKKKILITGCSGFLAKYLISDLISDNCQIAGITEINDFRYDGIEVYSSDIRDFNSVRDVMEKTAPDTIIHLAAVSNVGFSWKNPLLTFGVNIIGSANLLEAARMIAPDARILLMSSAEVYKTERDKKLSERSEIDLSNPYALSKYTMELLADLYIDFYNMDILKIRAFNFIGPGQSSSFVVSDFSRQIALIEKGKSEPVLSVGNLSARRDFSDVRDVALYLKKIIEKGESGDLVNICSGELFSIEEILDKLLKLSSLKIEVITDEDKFRITDSPEILGNCNLLRKKFKIFPKYKIDDTLADSLEYWRKNV